LKQILAARRRMPTTRRKSDSFAMDPNEVQGIVATVLHSTDLPSLQPAVQRLCKLLADNEDQVGVILKTVDAGLVARIVEFLHLPENDNDIREQVSR
jgi:hypothetical protein